MIFFANFVLCIAWVCTVFKMSITIEAYKFKPEEQFDAKKGPYLKMQFKRVKARISLK